eukprot:COSAG05_NODE_1687_length_4280_cov_15.580244_6_plen_86_part_00
MDYTKLWKCIQVGQTLRQAQVAQQKMDKMGGSPAHARRGVGGFGRPLNLTEDESAAIDPVVEEIKRTDFPQLMIRLEQFSEHFSN